MELQNNMSNLFKFLLLIIINGASLFFVLRLSTFDKVDFMTDYLSKVNISLFIDLARIIFIASLLLIFLQIFKLIKNYNK